MTVTFYNGQFVVPYNQNTYHANKLHSKKDNGRQFHFAKSTSMAFIIEELEGEYILQKAGTHHIIGNEWSKYGTIFSNV